ncbi:hypothetical protein H0R92_12730 [Treponema sp. OMZ 840]|uniref:hypothetical protein n=1 Tax=Treponema sp. OMZ 840 TaxID=244313 RepID=UPI003D921770
MLNKRVVSYVIFIVMMTCVFAENGFRGLFERYEKLYADKPEKELNLNKLIGRDGVLFYFENKNPQKQGNYYQLMFFGSMQKVHYTFIHEGTTWFIYEEYFMYQERYTTENAKITERYYKVENGRISCFDKRSNSIENTAETDAKIQAVIKLVKEYMNK